MSTPSPAITALPAAGRAVLYSLATAASGRGKNSLLKRLQLQQVTMPDGKAANNENLSALLDLLEHAGWITRTITTKGHSNHLVEGQRYPVLLHLHQWRDARSWLQAARKHLQPANPWQGIPLDATRELVWLELLEGRLPGVIDSLQALNRYMSLERLHAIHPMHQMSNDAQGLELFFRLGDEVRALLLEDYLDLCNQFLMPCRAAYELGLEHARAIPAEEEGELHFQLIHQALWRGDWHSLESLCRNGYSQFRDILASLLKGDAARTLELVQGWMSDLRKQTGKRKIDLPPLFNAVYGLALIGGYQPTHRTALKQVLSTGLKAGYGSAYPILDSYFERLQGLALEQRSLHLPTRLNGLDGLMLALGLYWQDAEPSRTKEWQNALEDYRRVLEDGHFAWLAAEFDALLTAQFGEPRRLAHVHREAGLRPLLELQQRQESWQRALQALTRLKPANAAAPDTARTSRLAWFIESSRYGRKVEPREQKLGAKGQWSKGKAVALRRLVEGGPSMEFLTEQDRLVIGKIQIIQTFYGSPGYELPADAALPDLVGHPALYWMDAPDVRLDLVADQPRLQLRVEGEQVHLQLHPDVPGVGQSLVIQKETPTRVRLYPSNPDLRQIAAIVGNGLGVPLSAKAQLVEAMAAIAPMLAIHSEIPELTSELDTIPADERLYVHLLPLQAGLRLQLLVRPLGSGGWFRPGHGSRSLVGEQDGKAVQVLRDLENEKKRFEDVLEKCPGLSLAESDGTEWQLQQPQEALQVLGELKALEGEALQCVWPEGEHMRIRGRSALGQLRLGLKQRGDWFILQGGIDLDDGKVLQLRQLLELLKASPGRFINLGDRDWLALDDRLRRQLEELGGLAERVTDRGLQLSTLSAPLLETLAGEAGAFEADSHWRAHLERLAAMRNHQPQVPRTLQAQLRDYQLEGFCWLSRLAHWGVGACLADDMGLGKTVQTLALLLERAPQGPQLVVAPTSVTLNWRAECARFAPGLRTRLYHEVRSLEDLGPLDLVIVSYGLLQQDSEAFAARRWTSAVLDEAQAIKNAQTKRSQAAMALQADFRLVATGTPLENHLGELWNLFRFINPGLLGSQESFTARFATPIEQGDAAARRALRKLIQPFILRRLKSQVLDELPARTEITYRVSLASEEAHLYEALRQQALDTIEQVATDGARPLQVLAEITRLRRFCCHPSLSVPGSPLAGSKLQAFAEIVEELRESGHRALVFSQFVDHLQIVRAWLEHNGIEHQYLDGSTAAKERQKRVEAFQAGSGDLFLISLKAGGSGLNLTAADYVIHLDPWWNPAVEDQASDRAHRMGQQRPVTIYRLVTENTIEEQIVALHQRKRDLADSLLEGGEMSARLDAEALLRLLRGESD